MWAQPCAHVIFDTDPTPRGRNGPAEEEEMSQAMIRSVTETLTRWLLEKIMPFEASQAVFWLLQ